MKPTDEQLVAFRHRLCGAWTLSCIERLVQDRQDDDTA